jgi:hypothetical protein
MSPLHRPCIPPFYLECGCNVPSVFPEKVQNDLKDYGEAVVKALGFKYGCFHVECMYTKDGPLLIECNPRYAQPASCRAPAGCRFLKAPATLRLPEAIQNQWIYHLLMPIPNTVVVRMRQDVKRTV